MKIMNTKKVYEQWLEYRNQIDTFQQAIYFSLGVLNTQPEDATPYIGSADNECLDLVRLLEELSEFAESKSIHRFKCKEVDSSFLDEFKIFLKLKQVEVYPSFISIHLIFIMADLFDLPYLDLDMFEKWMSTNFIEFDKKPKLKKN